MKKLFDIEMGKNPTLQNGILIHSELDEGYCGVLQMKQFDFLALERDTRSSFYVTKSFSKTLDALYQNPNYPLPNVEPYRRNGPATYLGTSFSKLDELVTSDNGIFYSTKNVREGPGSTRFNNNPERSETVYFEDGDVQGVAQYFGHLLPRMGVDPQDVTPIVDVIFSKFNLPTDTTSRIITEDFEKKSEMGFLTLANESLIGKYR